MKMEAPEQCYLTELLIHEAIKTILPSNIIYQAGYNVDGEYYSDHPNVTGEVTRSLPNSYFIHDGTVYIITECGSGGIDIDEWHIKFFEPNQTSSIVEAIRSFASAGIITDSA